MGLDTFLRKVEHRTHLERTLADAEGPLNHPETVVLRYDLLPRQVRVRYIALQAIPKTVLSYLSLIDAYGYVLADVEELVVAPFVYVVLGQGAFRIGPAESLDSPAAVPCVFPCPRIRVAHNQPLSVIPAALNNAPVRPVGFQNPVFYLPGLVPYSRPEDVPVAGGLQQFHILCAHKPGIGHDDEVRQVEPPDKVVDYGYHRAPLILAAVEDGVGHRVAVLAHQQSEDYLRFCSLAVLREACPAKLIVRIRRGLEVKRGHVVEDDPYPPAEDSQRVLHAYPLDLLALSAVQPVHVAVDVVQPDVLVEIGLQVLYRGHLAPWLAYPRDDKMAQDTVPDCPEADSVVYVAEDNLRRVLERPLDPGNGVPRFTERLSAVVKVKRQLAGIYVYPLTRLDLKPGYLIGVGRHAYRLQLLEPAAALVRDNHTDCAAPVLLFAHKHAIKILILGLRHPRHR